MCGIFGFIGKAGCDAKLLLRIALHTEAKRGGHAFGWSWVDKRGVLRVYKRSGRLADRKGDVDMVDGALAVCGHVRWATQGNPLHQQNNHPHPADGGWVVHNGVIRPELYTLLERTLGPFVSDCDSEAICRLIEDSRARTVTERVGEALSTITCLSKAAVMGLWHRPTRVVVGRVGNPLHGARLNGGTYVASLAESFGLGVRAYQFEDGKVVLMDLDSEAGVRHPKAKAGGNGKPKAKATA